MDHNQPSAAEIVADAVVHVLGVLFAMGAISFLFPKAAALENGFSLVVYGCGLAGMLGASAVYNLWSGPAKEALRRLDHAMIFVMIAGSYTPFVVMRLNGSAAAWLGGVVWSGAVLGIVLKLLSPRRLERLSLALYLGLGWALLLGFGSFMDAVAHSTLTLLVIGGVLYTMGVPIHLAHRLRFHDAVWHACVLAAAICHFTAIAGEFV
ncbi:MAG TPA: hemolysin III family protein [Magnetospirillum sp.]|nr:hemolysin III family protein [Magnetospirillum sp.]